MSKMVGNVTWLTAMIFLLAVEQFKHWKQNPENQDKDAARHYPGTNFAQIREVLRAFGKKISTSQIISHLELLASRRMRGFDPAEAKLINDRDGERNSERRCTVSA